MSVTLMNCVFIGIIVIIFLASISTLPGILTQIMLVIGGIGYLRCGNILSSTDSTIHSNKYLSPFSLYLYSSFKRQFILQIITLFSTLAFSFFPIIESIFTPSLHITSIGAVVIIGSIGQGFKGVANSTYVCNVQGGCTYRLNDREQQECQC